VQRSASAAQGQRIMLVRTDGKILASASATMGRTGVDDSEGCHAGRTDSLSYYVLTRNML